MRTPLAFLSIVLGCWLLLLSDVGALRRKGACSWVYHPNSSCYSDNIICSNGKCLDSRLLCNGRDDCGDNSDERYCSSSSSSSSNCERLSPRMTSCSSYSKCIPQDWICDGVRDCPYGDDETNCENKQGTATTIKNRALRWFSAQKTSDTWGTFVDKAAVAISLANNSWTGRSNATRRETGYEVSIQLLSKLANNKMSDIPSSDLASYVNALLVTCLDPRKFHGHDIVRELRYRVDSQNYTNPYVFLALCNAGDTITNIDKLKLIYVIWAKHRVFWTDVQAVAVMALACASQQPGNDVDPDVMRDLLLELKLHQYENGTVENLQTTALVMQALLSAESDADPQNFNEDRAMQAIYAMQRSDGSFGSLEDTYYVLPVLNCKSLVNVSSAGCDSHHKDETSALEDLSSRGGSKIRVKYSLWIGNNKDLQRNLALRVPANMSFYGIMELAQDIDSRYRFEYVVKNNKPYVNVLSGLKDNPERGKFWFLYTIVDRKPSPSEESPADLIPKNNDHLVMWYRSGSWVD